MVLWKWVRIFSRADPCLTEDSCHTNFKSCNTNHHLLSGLLWETQENERWDTSLTKRQREKRQEDKKKGITPNQLFLLFSYFEDWLWNPLFSAHVFSYFLFFSAPGTVIWPILWLHFQGSPRTPDPSQVLTVSHRIYGCCVPLQSPSFCSWLPL